MMFKSSDTTFYRLDRYIAEYGHTLPHVVRVGKGLCGTSTDQTIDSGEALIIYKVVRNRKILARDVRGRELCLPRTCNYMVELTDNSCKHEYDTLVNVPSRYFCVLQDIVSFRLVAGDILVFTQEPPHHPQACSLRCRLVSLKELVCIDLPANLEGKFQSLPNYGIVTMDQVLNESSLPVNASLMPQDQTTKISQGSEQATSPMEKLENVRIEREIEEETVFVYSPSKNSVLMFPKTLNIFVTQCVPQQEFLSRSGTEYEQFLSAIENDYALQSTLGANSVYFTSEPVRRYNFEKLQFPSSFRLEKMERRVGERKQEEMITQESLDFPFQQQTAASSSESIQPCSFSENQAPPLPSKMLTLTASQHQLTSENEQVHHTESKQESEKHGNSLPMRCQQEQQNDLHSHNLFMNRDSHENSKTGTTRSSRLMADDANRMQFSGDRLSGSEKVVFFACDPQFDVNANLTVNSGMACQRVRKGTSANYLQSKQPSCNEPCSLPGIKTWEDFNTATNKKVTDMAKCKEHTMYKYSVSSTEQSNEVSGTQRSPEPLVLKQHDFSQTLQDENAVTNKKAWRKEHNIHKCSASSTEQSLSDEDNEETDGYNDFLVFAFHEKLGDFTSNIPQREETGMNADRVRDKARKELEASSERVCRTNGDNTKKGLFHSLTRRPRWFRQDENKPGRKEKRQTSKTKTEAVRIPPRHAASCEDLWISSPQEDDFECMKNIKTYLETKEKLTKALVKINSLEKQGLKLADSMPENPKELPNTQKISGENRKARKEKDNDVESQKNPEGSQLKSNQSYSTQVKSIPITSSDTSKDTCASLSTPMDRSVLNRGSLTCQNSNPNDSSDNGESEISHYETSNRTYGMSHNIHGCTTSYDGSDTEYMLMLPTFNPQRDNGHNKDHSTRRDNEDEDLHLEDSCVFSRNVESATKQELKKVILQMEWAEEEWMELTEMVRRQFKRPNVPYANLAFHGRRGSLPTDPTLTDTSSTREYTRRGMPPYVNLTEGQGMPATQPFDNDQQARQEFVNGMQKLANRSAGKPPIPTPRSGRSSV